MWGGQTDQREEDDELYGGYNDPAGRVVPLGQDVQSGPLATAVPGSRWGALPSTAAIGQPLQARPMTSIRGAGYTSQPKPGTSGGAGRVFDPFNVAGRGPPPPLAKREDNSPEDKAKEMERRVNSLVEEACVLSSKGQNEPALEKAKEAGKRERLLCKHRVQHGLQESINIDLTYAVLFTLAAMYHRSGMMDEALSTYALIVKNKQYAQAGRLRVNMGNIYYEQKKFPPAIKMYRMALDQIPNTNRNVRFRIMRNIGNAFVRLGMFADAIGSYEGIMDTLPDYRTGFNLIICYFALGHADSMKKGFMRILSIPQYYELEDGDSLEDDDETATGRDQLRQDIMRRKKQAIQYVSTAARLIAPVIEATFEAGYDFLIALLRSSPFPEIALEMENQKAIAYFKSRNFDRATETLKNFVKTDGALVARAATNLSFVYLLENDIPSAEKYARMAVDAERYNARALVNLGNTHFAKGELDKAQDLYRDALGAEIDCTEALYNTGLTFKRANKLEDSLRSFQKLRVMMPQSPEVMYHIADNYEKLGQYQDAVKWFQMLHTRVPTDPTVLARLGQACQAAGEGHQASQYFNESYNLMPTNITVITWLAGQHVSSELWEKALPLLERAIEIEPGEPKWLLISGSCLRRSGAHQQALARYQHCLKLFPNNLECLRALVHLSNDMGLGDKAVEYSTLLRKAEENAPAAPVQQHQAFDDGRSSSRNSRSDRSDSGPLSSLPVAPIPTYEAMRAPATPPGQLRKAKQRQDDADDWGELDDNLLPQ
eukprot:TRINITY_DN6238_c0_g1_i1.p1 TRINITY_DN6238_c0_g1~~TRINITY_DN6238_c0_g1_i1.p1  ORF type:complete len:772 (-),score=174.54 TRINITY_DN6238_c0_g1_i1:15-2330(-)